MTNPRASYLDNRSERGNPLHRKLDGASTDLSVPIEERVPDGMPPLPTKEELLAQNPTWTCDKEVAKEQNRPWLTPDLNLRDPHTGWILPGTPRAWDSEQRKRVVNKPKRASIVGELNKLLKHNPDIATALAAKLLKEALSDKGGALQALKEALDRVDGPVKQAIDLTARQIEEEITLVDRDAPVPIPGLETDNDGPTRKVGPVGDSHS